MFPLHPSLSIPSPKGTIVTSRGAISRLRQQLQSDRGIGMAEVIVALMVFSIIAVGMAFSLMSISRLTGEATTREAAANRKDADRDSLTPHCCARRQWQSARAGNHARIRARGCRTDWQCAAGG